jgi:hypothetical protein
MTTGVPPFPGGVFLAVLGAFEGRFWPRTSPSRSRQAPKTQSGRDLAYKETSLAIHGKEGVSGSSPDVGSAHSGVDRLIDRVGGAQVAVRAQPLVERHTHDLFGVQRALDPAVEWTPSDGQFDVPPGSISPYGHAVVPGRYGATSVAPGM